VDLEDLFAAARAARASAYAPFSGYAVGAAVRTADGRIFAGCNVENRSFGLTLCAERAAVAAAVAAGARELRAVAIVTDDDPPAAPCGSCREVLAEFGDDGLPVHLEGRGGARRTLTLGELLPHRFALPPRRPAAD
jgi:cytidine deaminase